MERSEADAACGLDPVGDEHPSHFLPKLRRAHRGACNVLNGWRQLSCHACATLEASELAHQARKLIVFETARSIHGISRHHIARLPSICLQAEHVKRGAQLANVNGAAAASDAAAAATTAAATTTNDTATTIGTAATAAGNDYGCATSADGAATANDNGRAITTADGAADRRRGVVVVIVVIVVIGILRLRLRLIRPTRFILPLLVRLIAGATAGATAGAPLLLTLLLRIADRSQQVARGVALVSTLPLNGGVPFGAVLVRQTASPAACF